MRSCIRSFAAGLLLALMIAVPGPAWCGRNEGPAKEQPAQEAQSAQPADPDRKPSVTSHTFMQPGSPFDYTATAGYLRLRDESDKPRADLFFTAYTMKETDTNSRPLTFLFNGGPGASSIWLHLGLAGPVRVITGEDRSPAGPPYEVVPNPFSWLPWTDLVFIDPVGTGYSRAVPPTEAKAFYSAREDIKWVGEFIRVYISTNGRWSSPKCLAGESYGAMRAAGLLRYLYDSYGMEIDGLVLISPALDIDTIRFNSANDLPYALFAPSYAAVAWYHGKIAPEYRANLPDTLARVEKWTAEEYLPALYRGDSLPGHEKVRIASQLARFTGLPEQLLLNNGLRVSRPEFASELLRHEGLGLGFMDGRTVIWGGGGGGFLNDPGMAATIGPYTGALNAYMKDVLKFSPSVAYITFSEEVNGSWNWGPAVAGQIDFVDPIRKTVNRNRRLKIFAAAGYFDLDIPYLATEYMMNHLGIDPGLRENIRVRFFPGGHMFYTGNEALEGFAREAVLFFSNWENTRTAQVEGASHSRPH